MTCGHGSAPKVLMGYISLKALVRNSNAHSASIGSPYYGQAVSIAASSAA